MKKSKFQIKGPRLIKLNYCANNDFNSSVSVSLDINSETIIKQSDNHAVVRLSLDIFKEEDLENIPFFINIVMEAGFSWDESIKDKKLEGLLNENAPAILLSYMRPYISSVTSGSGFPPLILPLIDFTENTAIYEKAPRRGSDSSLCQTKKT